MAAAQSAAAATGAARWQQHGGCGGFAGTVQECANVHALKCHQCADVRVFLLGQGRRDNSTNGIVVVRNNGSARGDVHRGRQCAAANDDNNADDNTADANGNADDIVCYTKLNLLIFIYIYHYYT